MSNSQPHDLGRQLTCAINKRNGTERNWNRASQSQIQLNPPLWVPARPSVRLPACLPAPDCAVCSFSLSLAVENSRGRYPSSNKTSSSTCQFDSPSRRVGREAPATADAPGWRYRTGPGLATRSSSACARSGRLGAAAAGTTRPRPPHPPRRTFTTAASITTGSAGVTTPVGRSLGRARRIRCLLWLAPCSLLAGGSVSIRRITSIFHVGLVLLDAVDFPTLLSNFSLLITSRCGL